MPALTTLPVGPPGAPLHPFWERLRTEPLHLRIEFAKTLSSRREKSNLRISSKGVVPSPCQRKSQAVTNTSGSDSEMQRFESCRPSQPVRSLWVMSASEKYALSPLLASVLGVGEAASGGGLGHAHLPQSASASRFPSLLDLHCWI
jgi:hypothetical protein